MQINRILAETSFWDTTLARLLVIVVLSLIIGGMSYWIASRPRPPIEVYVHFDQPLVVKVQ